MAANTDYSSFTNWRGSHSYNFGDDDYAPLLEAQAYAESGGKHQDPETGELTTSPVGAVGLAQLMPATATDPGYGVAPVADINDPDEQIRFQRDYMMAMLDINDGDVMSALASYNAGYGNVQKAKGTAEVAGDEDNWMQYLPMPEETIPYVEKIAGYFTEAKDMDVQVNGEQVAPEQVEQAVDQAESLTPEEAEEAAVALAAETGEAEVEVEGVDEEAVDEAMDQVSATYDEATDNPEDDRIWDPVMEHWVTKPSAPLENATEDMLREDQNWVNASWEMYTFWEHQPPPEDMTNEDLAEWGLQFMANLDWSIIHLGRVSHRFSNLHDLRSKLALNYMMDQMDNKDKSWEGTWRGTKAFFLDPLNVLGIGTGGTATAGKMAAQAAAKQGLKAMLKQSLQRTGVVVGLEGMLYGGTDNIMSQNLDLELGRRDEFSNLEVAGSALVGGAVGAAGGTAVDAVATGVANKMARNRLMNRYFHSRSRGKRMSDEDMQNLERLLDEKEFSEWAEMQKKFKNEGKDAPTDRKAKGKWKKPKGRSPEDDVDIPTNYYSQRKLKKLGLTPDTVYKAFRATPRKLSEAMDMARPLADAMKGLRVKNAKAVVEGIRRMTFKNDEFYNMKEATGEAWLSLHMEKARLLNLRNNVETDPKKIADLTEKLEEIEELYTPMRMLHESFGSEAGALLRAERGSRGKLRRMEINEIKRQNPGMTERDAEQFFIDMTKRLEVDEAIDAINKKYRVEIDNAQQRADWQRMKELWWQREAEIDAWNDKIPDYLRDDLGYNKWAKSQNADMTKGEKFKDVSEKLNEIFISNVFSLTTVAINLVPSSMKILAKPAIESLFKHPFERATWVETFASYNAMAAGAQAALKAGKMAFKYEQSILAGGHMRLMEQHLMNMGTRNPKLWNWINNIRSSVPGAMRTFPRILNATDEILSRAAHDGYVAGRAAGQTYADAIASGVDRRAARKLADKAAKAAMESKETVEMIDRKMNILLNKGKNLGYRGSELRTYVQKNFDDIRDMKLSDDYSAISYVKDALYKKDFDPTTSLGKTGIWAENLMQDQPWIKWATGQLFFRTPIRVIEESLRYTPGLQYAMPNFYSDLLGKNGLGRQAAAQGQQLLSMAFAAHTIMNYANAEIEGANMTRGMSDYRHKRLRYDAANMEDYNVDIFGTGNHWSYRIFDPIATPYKIMVNSLEYFDHLKIREAQGEFIGPNQYKEGMAIFSGVLLPTVAAIADANLLGGLSTTMRVTSGLENMQGENNVFYRLLSERIRWMTPNTAHKIERARGGEFRDPSGFGRDGLTQNVLTGLGPLGARLEEIYELHTPRSYDIFGNTRQVTNKSSLHNLFGTSSPQDRMGNLSDMQAVVLDELRGLQGRANVYFTNKYKHAETGDLDLRTVRTADGKWSLYDRWHQILNSLPQDEVLFEFLMRDDIPEGVPGNPGPRPKGVQEIMEDFRNRAFAILYQEEKEVIKPLLVRGEVGREIKQMWTPNPRDRRTDEWIEGYVQQ